MDSKLEAKDILLEYLEEMMPMMVERWRVESGIESGRWRKNSKELINDYSKSGDLSVIVYQGFNPKNKTFYLLTPYALAPKITLTLNFSKRGFL